MALKYDFPQITPHSPNVASLERYGSVPVSMQTGMPNISIPLFTIDLGSVKVPITLTYHNNGLKPDEIPSWVGLGWDLQAGGALGYQQRGRRDFAMNGLLGGGTSKTQLYKYVNSQMTAIEKQHYFEKILAGEYDTEYDMYTYNFLGNSGAFYFNKEGNIVSVPKNNFKFQPFSITDQSGNQFEFGETEYFRSAGDAGAVELMPDDQGISAYLLNKVKAINGKQADFTYTGYKFQYYRNSYSYKQIAGGIDPAGKPACPKTGVDDAVTTYYGQDSKLLEGISFPDGRIEFVHSTIGRKDLQRLSPGYFMPYLSKIRVYNLRNELVKEYKFAYSYFGDENVSGAQLRLRLDSLTLNNDPGQSWVFTYHTGSVNFPSFFSNDQDHWGYWNGESAGLTRLPKPNYNMVNLPAIWQNSDGYFKDRTSHFSYSKAGMLTQIKYPTGGTSSFYYEPNQIKAHSFAQIDGLSPFFRRTVAGSGSSNWTNFLDINTESESEISGSFTITQPTQVKISALKAYDPQNFTDSYIYFGPSASYNLQTDLLLGYYSLSYNEYAFYDQTTTLSPGTYYYRLVKNDPDLQHPENGRTFLSIDSLSVVQPQVVPYEVGGGRVEKIEDWSGDGQLTQVKQYVYNDWLDSVSFQNIPQYTVARKIKAQTPEVVDLSCTDCGFYTLLHDQSIFPLEGNSVDYIYVDEIIGNEAGNGKKKYQFTVKNNLNGNAYPVIPPLYTNWRAGLPKQTNTFRAEGVAPVLIASEVNNYESAGVYDSVTRSIKVDYDCQCLGYSNLNSNDPGQMGNTFFVSVNNHPTETFYDKGSITTNYEKNNTVTNSKANLYLSPYHSLISEVQMPNSAGITEKIKTYYSLDYVATVYGDSAAKGILLLKDKNILTPIEQFTTRIANGVEYVTGGLLFIYKSDIPALKEVRRLNIVEPIPLSSFNLCKIDVSGNFVFDSRYAPIAQFNNYNDFLNVLEQQKDKDAKEVYLWGYGGQYPVAKIVGSDYNTVIGKVASLETQINITTGGSNSDAAVRSLLNSLRTAFASDAAVQVSSYTYRLLVGVTSETDPSGRTTYYEYDGFGRLSLVKDDQGRVLKKICYNYAGQPVNCN
ncbi:RHS repeat domain-containing protein [Niabella sp.]|uniref:RHS repeat domain-containing protein n=1 Tax=Niabella sp. TaxID=1962976 RepID=UPI0026049EC1|nr:RHS repeat domain-containing protein [Niabella sp.]